MSGVHLSIGRVSGRDAMTVICPQTDRESKAGKPSCQRWWSAPHAGRTLAEESSHLVLEFTARSARRDEMAAAMHPDFLFRARETESIELSVHSHGPAAERNFLTRRARWFADAAPVREMRKN
jgi:hypothetical protein